MDNCIMCGKGISEEYQGLITCSKECSKVYNRISPLINNFIYKPRKCITCRHSLDLESKKEKRLVCSKECSEIFDRILNRILVKEDDNKLDSSK